jgi:hypothetical protein
VKSGGSRVQCGGPGGRRRPDKIAVLRLDGEAAGFKQVMQLTAIGPAPRHLARVLGNDLAVGRDRGGKACQEEGHACAIGESLRLLGQVV